MLSQEFVHFSCCALQFPLVSLCHPFPIWDQSLFCAERALGSPASSSSGPGLVVVPTTPEGPGPQLPGLSQSQDPKSLCHFYFTYLFSL